MTDEYVGVLDAELSELDETELGERESAVSSLAGEVIDGRYRVEGKIGSGAMGLVYLARHVVLDSLVVLKVMRASYQAVPGIRERFLGEARAASQINHENVVRVLDFGTTADHLSYYVMEYIDGATLGDFVGDSRLSGEVIVDLARQIARGIQAAHRRGVVHRDLKPDNIMVFREAGQLRAKLLDFGIAKLRRVGKKLTQAGMVFGTPEYMSPEQALGKPADERSDVYSFGIVLYELACGDVPFSGSVELIIAQCAQTQVPSVASRVGPNDALPAGLLAIIDRCVQNQPADRYQSMDEILCELDSLSQTLVPVAGGAPSSRPRRKGRRGGVRQLAVAIVTIISLAAVLAPGNPQRIAHYVLPWITWLANQPVASEAPDHGEEASEFASSGPVVRTGVSSREAPPAEDSQGSRGGAEEGAAAGDVDSLGDLDAADVARERSAGSVQVGDVSTPAEPAHLPPKHIDLILFPLESRVYLDEEDLGPMPVSVTLAPDEKKVISVKHPGFRTQKAALTYETPERVIISLKRLPEDQLDAEVTADTDSVSGL